MIISISIFTNAKTENERLLWKIKTEEERKANRRKTGKCDYWEEKRIEIKTNEVLAKVIKP